MCCLNREGGVMCCLNREGGVTKGMVTSIRSVDPLLTEFWKNVSIFLNILP